MKKSLKYSIIVLATSIFGIQAGQGQEKVFCPDISKINKDFQANSWVLTGKSTGAKVIEFKGNISGTKEHEPQKFRFSYTSLDKGCWYEVSLDGYTRVAVGLYPQDSELDECKRFHEKANYFLCPEKITQKK